MATKHYPQTEESPHAVNEPAVEYQAESKYIPTPQIIESLRRSEKNYKAGRTYTKEEMDKTVAEWLRPHSMEEIQIICDEAEADDEANKLLDSSQVFAMMESKYPWLCK